jgi:peptidoglycan/xylan/chitin deacetylase (PgdA/CDA1 family)
MKLLLSGLVISLLLGIVSAVAADSNTMNIALIFDDGPFPEETQKLLAIFKEENISVTFGSVARKVESHAASAKAVLAAGHEIANHSYSHLHPKDLDDAALEREIAGAQKIIETTTSFAPKWYWPPFLESDDRVRAFAAKAKLEVYTPRHLVVSQDYKAEVTAQEIKRLATSNIRDGTVILFHEWRKETLEQMPAIIAELKRRGCVFHTFSALATYLKAAK